MAPPNLQGLNIVHPTIQADSHDLLSGQQYQDLSAQLDLWTNLAFDSEDGLTNARPTQEDKLNKKQGDDEDEESRSPVTTEKAVHDGHVNVVTGTNLGANETRQELPQAASLPAFDLNNFLLGFGIDPFTAPQAQQQPIAPSLAQILAFHSAAAAGQLPTPPPPFAALPHHALPSQPPSTSSSQTHILPSYRSNSAAPLAADPTPTASAQSGEDLQPSKKARTRKASVSSPPAEEIGLAGVSAAEDKRRRNTAASARFRLKKKEREAALEGKAKELELKVSELERECEALRRENGWLKGLVVGVTGAAQGPVPPPLIGAPQSMQNMTASSSSSGKRRREDGDSA